MGSLKGLVSKRDFSEVYNTGKSVVDRLLVLYYQPKNQPYTRFGFSVGKKTGKAVVRNRYKRILREICRNNLRQINDGYDCVIIARPRIINEDYRTVEKSFLKLLNKAKMTGKEMNAGENSGGVGN